MTVLHIRTYGSYRPRSEHAINYRKNQHDVIILFMVRDAAFLAILSRFYVQLTCVPGRPDVDILFMVQDAAFITILSHFYVQLTCVPCWSTILFTELLPADYNSYRK